MGCARLFLFSIQADLCIFQSAFTKRTENMHKQLTRLPYIICYLCAFALGMKQLRDPDIWWQLVNGRWMLDNGSISNVDTFSYTAAGKSWVNVNWLYQVVIAVLERGMGPHVVMLLQSLVNVAVVYMLLRMMLLFNQQLGKGLSTLFTTASVLLFLGVSEFSMVGSPEMVCLLLTAAYMLILWRSHDYSFKKIVWLIPLQCLGANMHEGFIIGLILVALYVVGGLINYLVYKNKDTLQAVVRLAAVWAGMIIVTMINPAGVQIWSNTIPLFGQPLADTGYFTARGIAHLTMLTMAVVYWIVVVLQNRKQKTPIVFSPLVSGYIISLLVLGALSKFRFSNIPYAQIMLLPTIPLALQSLIGLAKVPTKGFYTALAKRTTIVSAVAGCLFFVAIVSNAFYKFTGSNHAYGLHVATLHNPTTIAEFLRDNNIKGPGFTDEAVVPYLLWELYPDYKSFVDARGSKLFPTALLNDYREVNVLPEKFYDLDSMYKFNYIVLSTSAFSSLKQSIYWGEGFNVVHVDPVAMIFLKNNEANREVNYGPASKKLYTWPQESIDPGWAEALTGLLNPSVAYPEEDAINAPLKAASFYNSVNNARISLRFLLPIIQTDFADNAEAHTILGNAYKDYANFSQTKEERQQRLDSAAMYFNQSLKIDDNRFDTYLGLGILAIYNNDYNNGKKYLERGIAIDGTNGYAYFLNGLCYRSTWQSGASNSALKKVVYNFETSTQLDSANGKAYLFLAEAAWAHGERDKARNSLKKIVYRNIPWTKYDLELLEKLKKQMGFEHVKTPMQLINNDDHTGHDHNH